MTIEDTRLGPRVLGAEVLVGLAQRRSDGVLAWSRGEAAPVKFLFVGGRPEALVAGDSKALRGRDQVVAAVRGLAVAATGSCRFEPKAPPSLASSLGVDTLGESLLAMVKSLDDSVTQQACTARATQAVAPTQLFERLATAAQSVGGATVRKPAGKAEIGLLMKGQSSEAQRVWLALLALGGLKTVAADAPEPNKHPASSQKRSDAASPRSQQQPSGEPPLIKQKEMPEDPELRKVALDIQSTYRSLQGKTHYQILGVDKSTPAEEIRKAYFQLAKQWHVDRFAASGLSKEARAQVEEIFRLVSAAHDVLSDQEERRDYDLVIERQAKGLPTDPAVIMHAEHLFQQAQGLVRRGQAPAALPLLTEAVQLNKGEAEFWAYLGFALHCAKGKEGLADALDHINRAIKMNERMSDAYEFLGRIQRVEERFGEAQRSLRKALSLNPKNRDAELELRFLGRKMARKESKANKKGLLGRILKK